MSVKFDPNAVPAQRAQAGAHIVDVNSTIGAADLTTDELDEIVAQFAAQAAKARRDTWRRRPSVRTSMFRATNRKPRGGRK